MAIRYVCLSDLHLGAEYSLLSNVDNNGQVTPGQPSPTLEAFATAFDALLSSLPVDNRTRIVLLGDVLDMGFADTGDVIKTFIDFARALFTLPNVRKMSQEILYIPGNHDHEMWQEVKTQHLLRQVLNPADDDSLMQVTSLVDPEFLEARLVTDILKADPDLSQMSVQIAYPNFADAGNDRGVIMHHGHFFESMYLAMSNLKMLLTGGLQISDDIATIERENAHWINALWSNLGNAGFGAGALNFYETLLDPAGSHDFVVQAAARISRYLELQYGISDATTKSLTKKLTLDQLTRGLLDVSLDNFANSERYCYSSALAESSIEKLIWYLTEPVKKQLEAFPDLQPERISYRVIFGHTHKPFQAQLPVPGYGAPLQLFNLGGWTIDMPVIASVQGAAVVFVNDEFDVASLRLYNCSPDGEKCPPRAAGTGGYPDQDNSMLTLLAAALQPDSVPWKNFTDTVSTAILKQQQLALGRYFDPSSATGIREKTV